jgi:sec-independent protein translocase protein TatA
VNLGFPEIAIILLLALLLFGPRKLPELARGLGEAIREFKKEASAIREEPKPLDEKPLDDMSNTPHNR